jgi:GT2 family glycosyltransferase
LSFVDIIIPTFNNPGYLIPCLQSIIQQTGPAGLTEIIVVNNGHKDSFKHAELPTNFIRVIQAEKNLGWEGGLKLGLQHSEAPFVVFMNDDVYIPPQSRMWVNHLMSHFSYPDCAAAGPSSNVVMGPQNIFITQKDLILKVSFLIGFCMMVRRSDLNAAGGIDDTLPGGDDIDLSIRLRKLGKYLVCDRQTFVYHHGFKTGERVAGSYWNSAQMTEKTNHTLIRKHGLKEWFNTMNGAFETLGGEFDRRDLEAEVCRKYVVGEKILELGVGSKKTVENSLGIDLIKKGEVIPGLYNQEKSVADLIGDVNEPLNLEPESFDTIISRHILEHCLDTPDVLTNWGRILKIGGRLLIAVPNHDLLNTIPLNFQHVHAFNPKSLNTMMEHLGWKTVAIEDCNNKISFVGVFEKNGIHA